MKNIIASFILCVAAAPVMADNYHQGYIRNDGTYVQPHYQTAPDRNPYNNYSTQGNTNPYTGQAGNRDPYQVQQQYAPNTNSYGSGYNSNPYGTNQHPRSRW